MRIPPVALLLLATACAHARAPVAAPSGFEVRQTGQDDDAAAQVARVLPEAVHRVERWGALETPVVVRIHPDGATLAAAAGIPGDPWLRAWARRDSVDVQSPRTWSRGRASDEAMTTLLSHELTHCLLFRTLPGDWTRRDVPAWFEEGMATFTAGERHARADASALRPARGDGHPFDAALAYGTADRAFRYLIARHGDAAVHAVLRGLRSGERFPAAFRSATGSSLDSFEEAVRLHLAASASR